jgi:hypothetical protein
LAYSPLKFCNHLADGSMVKDNIIRIMHYQFYKCWIS